MATQKRCGLGRGTCAEKRIHLRALSSNTGDRARTGPSCNPALEVASRAFTNSPYLSVENSGFDSGGGGGNQLSVMGPCPRRVHTVYTLTFACQFRRCVDCILPKPSIDLQDNTVRL